MGVGYNSQGLQNPILAAASALFRGPSNHCKGPSSGKHFSRRSSNTAAKKCHKKGEHQRTTSRLLFDLFPCPQEGWRTTSHLRPSPLERPLEGLTLQDAAHEAHSRVCGTRRMVHHNRLERCLLSRADLSGAPTISPFHLSRTGLPVSGPPIWPLPVTQGVLQGCSSGLSTSSKERPKNYALPRRLANLCPIPQAGSGGYGAGFVPRPGPRLPGQLQEERPEPEADNVLFRTLPKFSHNEGISHPSESNLNPDSPLCFSPRQVHRATALPEVAGVNISGSGGSSTGPPQGPTLAALAEQLQPPPTEAQRPETHSDSVMHASPAPVAKCQFAHTGSSPGNATFQADAGVHRRLPDRLGSCLGRPDCEGHLGTPMGQGTHQCPGTQGHTSGAEGTSPLHTGEACSGADRQPLRCLSHQSPRRNEVSALPQGHPETPLLGTSTPGLTQGGVHPRRIESSCRSPLQVLPPTGRVEIASRGSHQFMGTLWRSPGGSLCVKGDNSLSDVVLPQLPLRTAGVRCPVPRVAGGVVVRVPSNTPDPASTEQNISGLTQSFVSGSTLAGKTLVSGSTAPCSRPTLASTGQIGPSFAGAGADLASQSSCSSVVGLAPPQSLPQGLNEAVLETINNARAPSTRANYQQRWKLFSLWCKNGGLDPKTCSIASVLHFLQSLLDTGRAASTVKVYAAAISAFHDMVGGLSVGKHPLVSQFLKGANRLRPGRCLRAPSWDLPMVLQSLTTAPYEPLAQSDLKFLTQKTLFLLALCSTKRVSELHALSVSTECMRWKPEDTAVSLWPNPFFLPKVLSPQSINSAIELEAFRPEPPCQAGVALHTLCPVRALRAYVDRTRQLRHAHTQLFVCYGDKQLGHPVSKQRLSHWLVDTISQAYAARAFPVPGGLVAHSTRSMATSWAALKGVALSDICAAASWGAPCTFTRFYRLNVTSSTVGGTVLMAAAGQTGVGRSFVPRDTSGTSHP